MHHSSTRRWLSLVGAIWLQSISGTNTNFPAYSSQLKNLLSISQVQLINLTLASDAGKLLGWVSGLATLHLPLWLVLLYGTALGMTGYGFQFIFLVRKIPSLSYWQIFLLTALAGNSICWINTVCYAITIRNFHAFDRQVAVGLSISYAGLSAKIYTVIVDAVSPDPSPEMKAKTYLFLNSMLPLLVSFVTAPLCRDIEITRSKGLETGFMVLFGITIITGAYAVLSTLDWWDMFSPSVNLIILGMFLVSPVLIPIVTKSREIVEHRRWVKLHDLSMEESCSEDDDGGIHEFHEEDTGGITVIEEIGVKLMLRRLNFWLYFFVYMFGATLGMVYMNNLGQIAGSRGTSKASSLVSFSSSFGFFGRLMPSLLDYFFPRNKLMASKPATIATLMTPMAGAFFLLLQPNDTCLYISTAIIGVCTGAIISLAVSTTSELFGTKNFSVNHNILVANIPLGSFCFGSLAAVIYEREGFEHQGSITCKGAHCYHTTFITWGLICSVGTLLSFVLNHLTRKYYTHTVLTRSNSSSSHSSRSSHSW